MTDLHADITDIGNGRRDGTATMTSTVLRPAYSRPGTIAPVIPHTVAIDDGQFKMLNLDPGPAVLEISMGSWVQSWDVNIPDSSTPITFKTLLDNYIPYEPGVVTETRASADRAEASAVRSESAADRAEASEQYVQGVVNDGAAAVRSVVASDADAAVNAASGAAAAQSAAEAAQRDAAGSKAAAAGSASAAAGSATTAGQHKSAAETAATSAGQSKTGAETAAATAGQHRAAAETARGDAEAAAGSAANAAAALVVADLTTAVAADKQAAESAQTVASAAATAAEDHRDAAAGFAAAADASAQASDTARIAAEQAASNAQQGIPAGGWTRGQLEQSVQDDLQRARTAMQELPVATPQAPGGLRLAGDLTGTSSEPRVASGAIKTTHVEDSAITKQKLANDVLGYFTPKLVDRGAYSTSTAYNPGDVVTYNYGRWYCTTAVAAGAWLAPSWVFLGLDAVAAATDPGGGRLWVKI